MLGLHNAGQLPVAQLTDRREGARLSTQLILRRLGKVDGRALRRFLFYRLEFYRRLRPLQENSPSTPATEPKLLDQLRHKMRVRHVAKLAFKKGQPASVRLRLGAGAMAASLHGWDG